MDRREFLRDTALGAAMGLTGLSCQMPPTGLSRDGGGGRDAAPQSSPPPAPALGGDLGSLPTLRGERYNVLFIALDDVNDWVGCLGGHPNASTPNIDQLASEGVLFERAYCTMPLCCPSRTSIFTGLRPSTTGVYGNFNCFRDSPRFKDWVTLPQHFRANGYRTLMGGKIFHGTMGKAWGRCCKIHRYPGPGRRSPLTTTGAMPCAACATAISATPGAARSCTITPRTRTSGRTWPATRPMPRSRSP